MTHKIARPHTQIFFFYFFTTSHPARDTRALIFDMCPTSSLETAVVAMNILLYPNLLGVELFSSFYCPVVTILRSFQEHLRQGLHLISLQGFHAVSLSALSAMFLTTGVEATAARCRGWRRRGITQPTRKHA